MPAVPKKVAERLSKMLGTFQKILASAKDRDVNESDTVTIVTDMLADLFGFDKYADITSEQAIRGTFCDLAVKLDGTVKYLIEVKAIGLSLKENHLRQALNYGANHGIPWVVLTNGIRWEIHRIKFERPIGNDLICSIDLSEMNPRRAEDIERLYLICKEGIVKAAIEEFHEHSQNVNRFVVAAIMQTEPVVSVIRREIRRLTPDAKVTIEEIEALLPDVLKRDVIEGEQAVAAARRVGRAANKALRKTKLDSEPDPPIDPVSTSDVDEPVID